jgi:hypothetical protein
LKFARILKKSNHHFSRRLKLIKKAMIMTSRATKVILAMIICFVLVGFVESSWSGALAAYFVNNSGRGLIASCFAGICAGVGGAASAFLFTLAVFRIIWLFRYIHHKRNKSSN